MKSVFNAFSKPPVPLSTGRHGHFTSLSGGYNDKSDNAVFLRAYKNSGTVYQIVSLLSNTVAATEWHMYRQQPVDARRRYTTSDMGSDQRTEVINHAALTLWQQPNDFQTRFEFHESTMQHLELTGEGWWVLDKENPLGIPTGMWMVRPDRIEPIPDPSDYLTGYMYTTPYGERIPLRVDEVIMIKYPDPEDPFRGCSPVRALMPDIDGMKYSSRWNRDYFLNSAEPGGMLSVPNRLKDEELDEVIDRWREQHRGVGRAHRVGVLEAGMTWVPNSTNQKDMDFVHLRNDGRDVIREGWGIHKSMLGNADDVNRANAETAEEVFGNTKIIPRLNRIRNIANHRLLPMFGSTGKGVEFDFDNPVPHSRELANTELTAKVNAVKALVDAGYNQEDALETVGLPSMRIAEKPTQAPALPPQWVPGPAPTETPGKPAGTSAKNTQSDEEIQNELTSMMAAYLDDHHLNGFAKAAW